MPPLSEATLAASTGSGYRAQRFLGGAMSLGNKTLFVTGGSRGIGLAIALRAARDGANVAIAAKTVKPDPRLPGTDLFGGRGHREGRRQGPAPRLRYPRTSRASRRPSPRLSRSSAASTSLLNNASAISLTGTLATPMKRYDLDAPDQRTRHVPGLAEVHPASREGRQSARPQPLAAARLRREVVRQSRGLYARQVRHVGLRLRQWPRSSRTRASPSTACGLVPASRRQQSRTF